MFFQHSIYFSLYEHGLPRVTDVLRVAETIVSLVYFKESFIVTKHVFRQL